MSGKKILFVDDEPMIVKIMKSRLEARKFVVETASNGKDAFEKANRDKPDLILLDIMMPGIDGYEVCRVLKANAGTRNIPVIMFTANQDEDFEDRARAVGAVNAVNKPFVAELLEAIDELFSG